MPKKYVDSKGKEYKIGDIVFNSSAGDFWLVEKYTKEEKMSYKTECDYCLSMYGSKDEYVVDIDEPEGFEIVCSIGDDGYQDYINEFEKIITRMRKEEEELDKMYELDKLTNRELMEKAFEQIEKETGFHIINKEYRSSYFLFEDEDDSICNFYIKEIPGFKFAFWNTCRFDTIKNQMERNAVLWSDSFEVCTQSELIFFTQYEKNIDKFKPSTSGFVTGIWRQKYVEDDKTLEVFHMYDLIDILNFMKKHPIKAYFYSGLQIKHVWDERSSFIALREFIRDMYYHYKEKITDWFKFKRYVFVSKRLCKKLKDFNTIIVDKSKCWSPRVNIHLRRKDNIDIKEYERQIDIIEEFEHKYFNKISVDEWEVYITTESTEDDIIKDKELRVRFRKLVRAIETEKDSEFNVLFKNIIDDMSRFKEN